MANRTETAAAPLILHTGDDEEKARNIMNRYPSIEAEIYYREYKGRKVAMIGGRPDDCLILYLAVLGLAR